MQQAISSSALRAGAAAPRALMSGRRRAVGAPLRHRRLSLQPAAAADPEPEGAADPDASSPSSPGSSSNGGGTPPWLRTVSLPMGLPTAGAVFFAAGFLKLVIMCFPWSEASIMAFVYGRSDLGVLAALKALPIALALAMGAKAIVDRGLQNRKWVQPAIVVGGILALWLSRLAFARPRPSPLDPMFRAMAQERAAAMADARRMAATSQQRVMPTPDAGRGAQLMQQSQQQPGAAGRGK